MADPRDLDTLTVGDDARSSGEPLRRPYLFLVLEGHRPLAAPARVDLGALDEVAIGRGQGRLIEAAPDGGRPQVVIRTDDRRMSSAHARLTKNQRRWVFEDTGSKNGSLVNSIPQTRASLADGDVIEIGQTFFVFRDTLFGDAAGPLIVDASAIEAPAPGLITLLPALERAFTRFASIARAKVPVIIQGETGTGKEVVARALHRLSGRGGELVAVNCGALPRDLVEAELFGHRRGAFSGATEDRPGLIRSSDKGTLFLDEIGDLPASSQAALLRVLQEQEVRPVGGTRAVPVDLRVVAATHRSLDRMAFTGAFRPDLLARLSGHRFELPPLRARREDIGLLIGALLQRLAPAQAARTTLHPRAAWALLQHPWPGNIRELEQCLASAVALAGEEPIEVEDLPAEVQRSIGVAAEEGEEDEATRRDEIIALLREHRGNVSAVAKQMGKARMQVQRWMKRYAIIPDSYRR